METSKTLKCLECQIVCYILFLLKIVHDLNSWIDEQIEKETISLRNKIESNADLTPTNFIEAYLIEMRHNEEFDSKYLFDCR